MSRKLLVFLLAMSLSKALYANALALYDEEQAMLNQADHPLAIPSEPPTEIRMIVFTPPSKDALKPDQEKVVRETVSLEIDGEPVTIEVESHRSEAGFRNAIKRLAEEEGGVGSG